MKDFYELLKEGYSVEQIHEMMNAELASAIDKKTEEDAKAAKAKETADKRNVTLNDARAHLISAIGLYNSVFEFGTFDEAEAAKLEELLIELEKYIVENHDLVNVFISATTDTRKGKSLEKYIDILNVLTDM